MHCLYYSDFYAASDHPRRSATHRRIEATDIRLTRMRQGAHALDDPATDELIVGVVLGGDTHCRWSWGDGWNITDHRRAGDMGLTPVRTSGQFEVDGDHELLVIGFSTAGLARTTNNDLSPDDLDFGWLHARYHRSGAGLALCRSLWRLADQNDVDAWHQSDLVTLRLLAHWRDLSGRAPRERAAVRPLDEALLRRMAAEIDARPGKRRPVAYWAGQAGLTSEHFCRAFKARTGETALRWSQKRRIGLIERRLQRPGSDIDRLVDEFGFNSRSHFTRVYTQITGRAPRETGGR